MGDHADPNSSADILMYVLPGVFALVGLFVLVSRDVFKKNKLSTGEIIFRVLLVITFLTFAAGLFFVIDTMRRKPAARPPVFGPGLQSPSQAK